MSDKMLTLKTMMELEEIDPADVKLIRHSLSDDGYCRFSPCLPKIMM